MAYRREKLGFGSVVKHHLWGVTARHSLGTIPTACWDNSPCLGQWSGAVYTCFSHLLFNAKIVATPRSPAPFVLGPLHSPGFIRDIYQTIFSETVKPINLPNREKPRYNRSMRIISRRRLVEFWEYHPDAEQPLRAWYAETKKANWKSPAEIKTIYRGASILPGNRVVFNIKGNTYRLVVLVEYSQGKMFIRFVGTHAEYDRIDATTI
jgi:mRNA interferase HigB